MRAAYGSLISPTPMPTEWKLAARKDLRTYSKCIKGLGDGSPSIASQGYDHTTVIDLLITPVILPESRFD